MKKFIEAQITFTQFDEDIIIMSGEFSGTDPWGDDIYGATPGE